MVLLWCYAVNSIIYTIGHSVHTIDIFIEMLHSFGVAFLVDIRSYPGSRRLPQYNEDELKRQLLQANIQYLHLPGLGGKRPVAESDTSAMQRFGGYDAYMQTEGFFQAISQLQQLAQEQRVAYMCAEAAWRHCHRSLVSEYLFRHGWQVVHITGIGESELHTEDALPPAQGNLF